MRLFKYSKKNCKNPDMSHWVGKTRVGYEMITANTEQEIEAAKKKGFTQSLPTGAPSKAKAEPEPVEVEETADDNENS